MMTEEEWLTCLDSVRMLQFLRHDIVLLVDELPTYSQREALRTFLLEAATRKLRLFACWCSRRIWTELLDDRSRKAVEMIERFVDDFATDEQRWEAKFGAIDARNAIRGHPIKRMAAHAAYAASDFEIEEAASESANVVTWVEGPSELSVARAEQAQILRCIFGNPFRPVAFEPAWRTSDVVALARGIYEDRAFDRMPILADGLQDAGCDNDDILNHCRDTTSPHARGCWVVDLILDKS
ncbi:MAG: hypothetical protein L0241_04645 [Planctomycetia bacterium]|nr:hypothetical protein [Planctomycetia bacterium]